VPVIATDTCDIGNCVRRYKLGSLVSPVNIQIELTRMVMENEIMPTPRIDLGSLDDLSWGRQKQELRDFVMRFVR